MSAMLAALYVLLMTCLLVTSSAKALSLAHSIREQSKPPSSCLPNGASRFASSWFRALLLLLLLMRPEKHQSPYSSRFSLLLPNNASAAHSRFFPIVQIGHCLPPSPELPTLLTGNAALPREGFATKIT
eukprot:5007114-Amphidinium_carterae.1